MIKVWCRMHIEDDWELSDSDKDFSYHYVVEAHDAINPPPKDYIPNESDDRRTHASIQIANRQSR